MRASKWKIRRTGWRGNWIDNPHDKWSNSAELLHFFRCVRWGLACFSVTSERYVGAIHWLMLCNRSSICKHTIPFWACLPCASSPLVTFFRRQSQAFESATARKWARYCAHCKLTIGEICIQLPFVACQRTLRWLASCHPYKIKKRATLSPLKTS